MTPGSAGSADVPAEMYSNIAFISMHRRCVDMIRSGLRSCPWGLTGYGFGPFAVVYPGEQRRRAGQLLGRPHRGHPRR